MASPPDDAAAAAQERARAMAEWLPELLDDAQTWTVADVKHALRAVSDTTGVARRWEPLSRRQEQWTGRAARRSSLRRATSSEATVASAQLHALLAFLLQDCDPAEFADAVQALSCGLAPPILAVRRRFLDAAAGAPEALELLRKGVAPACFREAQAKLMEGSGGGGGGGCGRADASAAAPSRRLFEQWVARSRPADAALFDVVAALCGLLPGFEPRNDAGKGVCVLQHLMEHMPYRLDLVYDLVAAGLSASVGVPLRETLAAHLFDRSTDGEEDATADGVSSAVLRWAAHMLSDGGAAASEEEGEEEDDEEEEEVDASATADAGGVVDARPAPAEAQPPEVEATGAKMAVAEAADDRTLLSSPAASAAPAPAAAASPASASLTPLPVAAPPPQPPSPVPSPPPRSPQPQRPSPVVAACPEPALRGTGALTLNSAAGAGAALRPTEGLRRRPQQQQASGHANHEEASPLRPAAVAGADAVEEIEVEESAQQPREGVVGRRREVEASLACGRRKANILSSKPPLSDATRGHSGTSGSVAGGAGSSSGHVRRTEEDEVQKDASDAAVHPAAAVAAAAPGYSAQHLIMGTPPGQPAAAPAGGLPSESASATATASEETCGDDGAFVLDARVEAPPPASALPRPLLRPAAAAAVCGVVEEEVSPDASPLGAAGAGAGAGADAAGQAPSLYPRHTIGGRGVSSSPAPTSISGAGEMHAGSPDPAPAARSLLVRPPVLGGARVAAEKTHAQESSPGGGGGTGTAADADCPALAQHPDLRLSRPSSRRGDGSSATLSSSAAAAAGRRWPQAEGSAAASAARTQVAEEESAGSVAASHASGPAWQRAGYSSSAAAAAAVSAVASRNGRRFAEEVEEEACDDGDECGSETGCERGRRRRVSAGAEVALDAAAQAPTRVLSARPSARTPSGARRRLGASSKAAWVTVEEEEVAGSGAGGDASATTTPPPPPPPLSPESPRVPPPPQAGSAVRPRLFYSAASAAPSASASTASSQQRAAGEGLRDLHGAPPPAAQAPQAGAQGKIFVEDLVDADDDEEGDAPVPDSFSPKAAAATPATAAAPVAEAARFAASPAVFGEGTLRASAARTAEVAAVARAPRAAAARQAVVTVDETVEPAEAPSPPPSPARLPAPEQAPQTEQELAAAAAASGKRVVSSDAIPRGVWRPTVLKGTPPPQQQAGVQKRWLDQELVEGEAEAQAQPHPHQHHHHQQQQQQQTWPWHGNDANSVSLSNVAQPRQSPFVSPLPARKAAKGQRCVYEDNALRGALRHSEELDADGRFVSSVLGRNTHGNGHSFTAPLKKGAVARMRTAAAADIQRVWRGRAGRARAAERRTLIYGPRPKAQHGSSSARRRQQTTPPPPSHQRRGGSKQRQSPASTRGSNTLYASPPPLAVY